MTVHQLSRADARRIAVRAQLLDSSRPAGLLDTVRRLTLLQLDPTAAIAPNADLVAWSRLGPSYAPAELAAALESRTLLELRAMIRPAEDLALYRAEMAQWPRPGLWSREPQRKWLEANDACRRDILDRLRSSGPLRSRDLPDTCAVPWQSTGWTNNRNVIQMLSLMVLRGEVAWPAAAAETGCGTWRTGSTRTRRWSRWRRRCAPASSEGCGRWASLVPRVRSARSSRCTWPRPASPRWSRGLGAPGGWIRPSWASPSPGGRRCCPPSTG